MNLMSLMSQTYSWIFKKKIVIYFKIPNDFVSVTNVFCWPKAVVPSGMILPSVGIWQCLEAFFVSTN